MYFKLTNATLTVRHLACKSVYPPHTFKTFNLQSMLNIHILRFLGLSVLNNSRINTEIYLCAISLSSFVSTLASDVIPATLQAKSLKNMIRHVRP